MTGHSSCYIEEVYVLYKDIHKNIYDSVGRSLAYQTTTVSSFYPTVVFKIT